VRCSSCEPVLDDYLEGTLSRRQMRDVSHHLHRCRACEALLHELRVVDALLATARPPGKVGDEFTEAVVSATRAAQPPAVKRFPFWVPLLAYLAVAWTCAGFAATRAGELAGFFAASVESGERGVAALGAASRAVAPATAVATAAFTGVLLVDLLLLCAVVYAYRRLRPMLAVYLARGSRS
jgi:anti-sigma factor RsiW